jgi:RNA polymerase-binding transcription factor DksA
VTGQPIAPERLEARPTARTNVDTEGQREGDGRLPRGGAGDPEEY